MTSEANAGRYGFKPERLSSHGRILRLAEAWPRTHRILEIGTASGYLGRELQRRGFSHVVGVEGDLDVAAIAREHYQEHVVVDLERGTLDGLGEFDVLICADVLEHLREPLVQLRTLARRLKPSGVVIVSLPNAVNWLVRLSVLSGRFTYTERGLFDRGHLRFFTRRTARAMIEEAGFVVERCDPTPLPMALATAGWLPAPVARVAEVVYYGAARCWMTMFAYQFVFLARNSPSRQSPG